MRHEGTLKGRIREEAASRISDGAMGMAANQAQKAQNRIPLLRILRIFAAEVLCGGRKTDSVVWVLCANGSRRRPDSASLCFLLSGFGISLAAWEYSTKSIYFIMITLHPRLFRTISAFLRQISASIFS